MFSPIWGKGNGRGISGFAVNRGAVNRGFTVSVILILLQLRKYHEWICLGLCPDYEVCSV